MSQYVISFAPELDLDVEAFVTAWNQHRAASQIAQAEIPDEATRDFAAGSRIVALVGGIAIGVATNALYDVIKEVATPLIYQQSSAAATSRNRCDMIEILESPPLQDGTRMILIVCKKDS